MSYLELYFLTLISIFCFFFSEISTASVAVECDLLPGNNLVC